ncbi:MAG: hypothetical protein ACRELB_06365 [Polyangiaceae bacterium]
MGTKRGPEQLWLALEKAADDDERAFQQAATASVAEAERQLAEAGVDVKAERERGAAMRRELEARVAARKAKAQAARAPTAAATAQAAPENATTAERAEPSHAPSPTPPPRRPMRLSRHVAPAALLFAVTVGAAVGGLAVFVAQNPELGLLPGGRPVGTSRRRPPPPPTPTELTTAAAHRRLAFAACDETRWDDCLAELEVARTLDPDGDDAPEVQAARRRALDAILARYPPGEKK